MKESWKKLLLIFFIEALFVFVFTPNSVIESALYREQQMTVDYLGSESFDWIVRRSQDTYQEYIVDSGLEAGLFEMFVPTDEARSRDASIGMENSGAELWIDYIAGRIEIFWTVIFLMIYRAFHLVTWAPFIVIMLVAAYFEGYFERRIRKHNFKNASHFLQGMAMSVLRSSYFFVAMLFIIPFAVPPLIYPGIGFMLALIIGISIGNLQKKI